MTFSYRETWWVVFWDNDRMRTPLPRKARFTSDEAMVEHPRAGYSMTLENKTILEMMLQRKSGEINLELTGDQYDKLSRS